MRITDCILCGAPLHEGDSNIELVCENGHKQSNVSIETNSKENSTTLGPNQTLSMHPMPASMGRPLTNSLPAIDDES
jgi:hypothetical protein